MRWKDLFGLLKDTVVGWYSGQSLQLGASLAFYGAFALAPTLVIAIAVAGMMFGEDAAKGQLASSLDVSLGPVVSKAFAETLAYVHVSQSGKQATLIGIGFVIFAATGLFIQLQLALNMIWGVQPKPGRGLWMMVRSRLLAFVIVLSLGALLLLLLIANTVLAIVHSFIPDAAWDAAPYLWNGVNWMVLIALLTLLFAVVFKLLPDAIITWRDVWIGAFITALLSTLGNYLIGYFLSNMAPAFAYWAASSLVVVMLWVYYSSQTLLFGAEFTKNFAHRFGDPVRPAKYAMYQPWHVVRSMETASAEPARSAGSS